MNNIYYKTFSSSVTVFTSVVMIATVRVEVVGSDSGVKLWLYFLLWTAHCVSSVDSVKVRTSLRGSCRFYLLACVAVFRPSDSLPLIYDSKE